MNVLTINRHHGKRSSDGAFRNPNRTTIEIKLTVISPNNEFKKGIASRVASNKICAGAPVEFVWGDSPFYPVSAYPPNINSTKPPSELRYTYRYTHTHTQTHASMYHIYGNMPDSRKRRTACSGLGARVRHGLHQRKCPSIEMNASVCRVWSSVPIVGSRG